MLAAGRGQLELARTLLDHGADAGRRTDVEEAGRVTPFELAAARGHTEVAALLEPIENRNRVDEP